MALIDNNGSRELLGADASGQLVIHAPTTAPLRQPRRKSRWPARLEETRGLPCSGRLHQPALERRQHRLGAVARA
jgi:hypothetical protein